MKKKRVRASQEVALVNAWAFANWLSTQFITDPIEYARRKGHRVFETMTRTSADAKAAILIKTLSVLSHGWQITNNETNDGNQQQQGDFVRSVLMGLPGGFEPVLRHGLSALKFGFSLAEKVYEPIKEGEWSGLWRYKVIRDKPVYDFDISIDEKGEIEGFLQNQKGGPLLIPRWKLVYYGYQATSDNPMGVSDLVPAFSHVFAQAVIDESWPAALKRYVMPLLVGTTQGALSKRQRKEFTDMLKKFQGETGIILDDQLTDVKFLEQTWSTQGYAAYERHQRYRSRQILLSVLVPQLMLSEGDRVGSKAMSVGQIRTFLIEVIAAIQREHAYIINKQIIEPLVNRNFMDVVAYPIFSYNPVDTEDDQMWADIITDYISSGVLSAEDDNPWIREKHGFEKRENETRNVDQGDTDE